MAELVIQETGDTADCCMVTLTLNFFSNFLSVNRMPVKLNIIVIVMIMGNYAVGKNHQPAKKDQASFIFNSLPQVFDVLVKIGTFLLVRWICKLKFLKFLEIKYFKKFFLKVLQAIKNLGTLL